MKKKILDFIFGAFWSKVTLLIIASILSWWVWEGAVFVILFLPYFIVGIIRNQKINKQKLLKKL